MNKRLLSYLFVSTILFAGACKKEIGNTEDTGNTEKAAPDGFAYETTKKIDINVRLLTRTNQPVSGVLVSLYDPSAVQEGKEITKVMSDKDGFIRTKVTIPGSLDTLVIDPAYMGLMSEAKAYIRNNSLSAIIGGEFGYSGNIVVATTSGSARKSSVMSSSRLSVGNRSVSAVNWGYETSLYNELGRPNNLEAVDKIDFAALMAQINHVLPEKEKVKDKYIATEVPSDLRIERLADVWITFVHEGADYRNSLAYYTYPTGHPPVKEADITNATLIFPNCSFPHNDANLTGAMQQGDKVKIGRFPAGTSIGFMVLQDAYKGNNNVNFDATKFFSTEGINPESDPRLRRHNVVLHNVSQRTFLIGFEDINREPKWGSDQDFNDLIVYAQSNPVEAISPIDIPYLDENIKDTDGDGVPDPIDEYPEDKNRAYNRYYPSQEIWGTTAFEDNWPNEGDYDLNDLVVKYRYTFAMSATNQLVDITGEYDALAAGADYQNGFGVQFPFTPSQISSVSGYNLSVGSTIKIDGKGLETNQSKAVVFPFDNYRNIFGANATQVNTTPGSAKVNGKLITVKINLSSPLSDDYTAMVPFNPFTTSNLERGREVHLVNHAPTDLANLKFYRTGADFSDLGAGKTYLTKDNRPFALDFYGPFEYPVEKTAIYEVYTHFSEWAKSGGDKYADWYLDLDGYRNSKLIYRK